MPLTTVLIILAGLAAVAAAAFVVGLLMRWRHRRLQVIEQELVEQRA